MEYYASSLEHILAELERIDLLIRAQVWRARQAQAGDGELQGFYISEQELEALKAQADYFEDALDGIRKRIEDLEMRAEDSRG